MNAVKDLLLNNLTKNGFTYFPSIKRLMLKNEANGNSQVIVIEMNQDNACRVFFSQKDRQSSEVTLDRMFHYNVETILSHVNMLLAGKTTNYQTAA